MVSEKRAWFGRVELLGEALWAWLNEVWSPVKPKEWLCCGCGFVGVV